MKGFLKTEKVYTILELNSIIRNLIKAKFPDYIWVCGEIQGLNLERGKRHIYFDLVQKHPEANEIIAKVRVALFENRKPAVFKRIQEAEGGFELKNDIEVKFLCEVNLHAPTGQYSLIIIDIDPVYTLGKVAQNRLRIIENLRKRGLLERNKFRKIPPLPLNIGLITAFGSAAYYDFINELSISRYGFKVFVYNSYMQGKNTEIDVVKGLRYFNSAELRIDVIVIIRGGGSKAELSWFDSAKIAEAVAFSEYPVLSGLGHYTDVSVTDMVSCKSLKTPTKVAQFLIERVAEVLSTIENLGKSILEKSDSLLEKEIEDLKIKTFKMSSLVTQYFRDARENLVKEESILFNTSRMLIKNEKRKIIESFKLLKKNLDNILSDAFQKIRHFESNIQLLNPRKVLKRGYSITLKNNKAVKFISQLKKGDWIKTIYFKGESISKINQIGENDEQEKF